jgi:thiamine phosphate synthase YjbQ (UPF0047 family)
MRHESRSRAGQDGVVVKHSFVNHDVVILGRYRRVCFCEVDSSRARKVFIQVIGE